MKTDAIAQNTIVLAAIFIGLLLVFGMILIFLRYNRGTILAAMEERGDLQRFLAENPQYDERGDESDE